MMQLYDAMIHRVRGLTEGLAVRSFSYDEKKAWPENSDFEMIFQKDVAYELGGGKEASENLTLVTSNSVLFEQMPCLAGEMAEQEEPRDQILVYGRDLQEIQGDVSYARICEVLVKAPAEETGTEETLKTLQDIDFVKFHVYGKGFMMRTSGQSAKEPVRVSKKALQDGITFEQMGNTFISHYKKNTNVLAVRVSFITGGSFDHEKLAEEAALAVEIRNSLSKIQKGLPTECSVCEIRDICNEVEGLRELHFGKKEKAGTNPASDKKRLF